MRRGVVTPLIITGLALAFVVVSCCVIITRGRESWIRRKLRIGALLLGFTVTLNTSCSITNCYAPPPENMITISMDHPYVLDLASANEIQATLSYRKVDTFSFRLVMKTDAGVSQGGDLIPDDGVFDTDTEHFTLLVDESLPAGEYTLEFYAVEEVNQQEAYIIQRYAVTLINSPDGK